VWVVRRARIGIAVVVACVALAACSSGVDRGAPTAHVVIDTGVGSDDLMATAYLLANPDVQVDAITVSGTGLVHCDAGVRNVLALLALAGARGLQARVHPSGS
jgi:uncharacterized membrane protein YraQ (UPF0718 family)